MKAEHINPFYLATQDVFKMMLDIETDRGNISIVENMIPGKEANVVLGITGDLRGSVLFSFTKEMVLEMVKIMSGIEVDTVDHFVSSALGEVANIIGGNAATKLTNENYICDIVPPQIFIGEYRSISMAAQKAILLPINTPIGELDINIFLKEK